MGYNLLIDAKILRLYTRLVAFDPNFLGLPSNCCLPETNSEFTPENRPFAPKGKDRIPTIHVSGANPAVSFRQGIFLFMDYFKQNLRLYKDPGTCTSYADGGRFRGRCFVFPFWSLQGGCHLAQIALSNTAVMPGRPKSYNSQIFSTAGTGKNLGTRGYLPMKKTTQMGPFKGVVTDLNSPKPWLV